MRSLEAFALLTITACTTVTCSQKQAPPRLEIVSLDHAITHGQGQQAKQAADGHVFVIVRARHQVESENDCSFDWQHVTVVDEQGRRYQPKEASEGRSTSSSTGPFGVRRKTVNPHEIWAVYELPLELKIKEIVIGEVFPAPEPLTTVVRGRRRQARASR
jgi:hypothetical protein